MASNWSLKRLFVNKEFKNGHDAEQCVSAAAIINAGDFTVDTVQRKVRLRGEDLRLTPEEFDVLVYLTGHPQQLVTPRTMLTTNWASDNRQRTEFLKVLLELRKKIEASASGKQYLRTEPWVVYRFDASPSLGS
jgi:two-component system KDP operon response regulator KdpE